jgi:hypothetical protein
VDVGLNIGLEAAFGTQVWHVVIHDHVDLLDVDTTGHHVGGDQDLGFTVPEPIEDAVTVLGVLLTMQGSDGVTFSLQPLGDLIRSVSFLDVSSETDE